MRLRTPGFVSTFAGHCCRCDRPIRKNRDRVLPSGRGYIHLDCASKGER